MYVVALVKHWANVCQLFCIGITLGLCLYNIGCICLKLALGHRWQCIGPTLVKEFILVLHWANVGYRLISLAGYWANVHVCISSLVLHWLNNIGPMKYQRCHILCPIDNQCYKPITYIGFILSIIFAKQKSKC